MGENTDVDVVSLDTFNTNLVNRRAQIETVIAQMNEKLKDNVPPLGTFQHAETLKGTYADMYGEFADRINRLMDAVVAAQDATAIIIENYRTAEQLNATSTETIRQRLEGVDGALASEGGA